MVAPVVENNVPKQKVFRKPGPKYPVVHARDVKTDKGSNAKKKVERYSAKDLEGFKAMLLEKREELEHQMKLTRNAALLGRSDDVRSEDDDGTVGQAVDLQRAEGANNQLRSIEDALRAIKDGTYGVCKVCGCCIPRDRLEAAPFVIRCVECKAKYEKDVAVAKRTQGLS
jgi:DnaK suppressor protein